MRLALFTLLTSVAAAPAFAADLGTYRPGTPYHSAIVPAADVCASQCSGDARCRGWNYVKANPKAPGVCEFQSAVGAPVSSAISISGVNETAGPVSNRIVAGNTNTIRVGTSMPAKPVAKPVETSRSKTRRIVRQPVPQPQARNVQAASYAAQPQRPRFQPMLDGQRVATQRPPAGYAPQPRPQMQTPDAPTVQSRGPARAARQPGNRQQMTPQAAPRQLMPQQAYAPQAAARPAYNGRPPIGQTIAPPADYRPPAQSQAPQSMPRASASEPVTFQNMSQGLYGSLHDDVRVPASNAAIPMDPNAPIPTASARPVGPVQQGLLPQPRG